MADSSGWCTIESDPGVFTELLTSIGVKGVQVSEVYSIDYGTLRALSSLEDLHGLVFLFAYGADTTRDGELVTPALGEVFFAKQVITNACATQAILSIVLNSPGIDCGAELAAFKEFVSAAAMDAETAGLTISNSQIIRDAHNSFAPVTNFAIDSSTNNNNEQKEDPFHFVSYVPVNGRLYELDGLQASPRDHGAISEDWREDAARVLSKRAEAFAAGELRFSLMAVVNDVQESIERELKELKDGERKLDLEEKLEAEIKGRARWKRENERRRTNFIPLIVQVLKVAAKKEKGSLLDDIVKKATAEKMERVAKEEGKEKAAAAAKATTTTTRK